MKIILSPDSFKHTMSASEVCSIGEKALKEVLPEAEIIKLPLADGGEGSIDVMLEATGGRRIDFNVKGPEFNEIKSHYAIINNTAIIELALICGLPMVSKPNAEMTTTYGVGQMIKKALDDNCEKIVLCVGGSATNDGGIGAIAALGGVFSDKDGNELIPIGLNLNKIASIDMKNLDPRLASTEILFAVDVNNPLYGENGASFVFAPQKGADHEMVLRLDEGLRNYASLIYNYTQKDISKIPGCGAAGGIAASFIAFSNASLKSGIEIILDTIEFDKKITGADLIITGEGKTDTQTMRGKAILGVAKRARLHNIPVIVISGALEDSVDELLYEEGICAVFSTNRQSKAFEEIKGHVSQWYGLMVKNIAKLYKLQKS